MEPHRPPPRTATAGHTSPPLHPTEEEEATTPVPAEPHAPTTTEDTAHAALHHTTTATAADAAGEDENAALAARQSRNREGAARMGGGQKLKDHQTAQRRLMQDYRTFQKNLAEGTSTGVTATPVDGNFFHWHAVISGPCDTAWEGGLFKLDLLFGDDYPFSPPTVRFRTKGVFHPNVYVDGNICMDTLKSSWQSSLNVESLLISIQSLLSDPNPMSAANGAAARLLTENRSAYDEKIRSIAEESLNQTFSDMDDEEEEDGEGAEEDG